MSRSKIRDSVVSALKDLGSDLEILVEKNEGSGGPNEEGKPLMKDKVGLVQKKIGIISSAILSGKVPNRQLPELMALCEIFTVNPDGTFEGCEADDVLDLLKQVSGKVASAFEVVCFDEWNLVPENRSSLSTPEPNHPVQETVPEVPKAAPVTLNGVESLQNEEEKEKPAPLPPVVEREPSVISNQSEESLVSKAQQFVQIARPLPKKPVVLFNPMAAKAAKAANKDEATPSKSGESLVGGGGGGDNSGINSPLAFAPGPPGSGVSSGGASTVISPPHAQPIVNASNQVFNFSAPPAAQRLPPPTIPVIPIQPLNFQNVANEIVKKALNSTLILPNQPTPVPPPRLTPVPTNAQNPFVLTFPPRMIPQSIPFVPTTAQIPQMAPTAQLFSLANLPPATVAGPSSYIPPVVSGDVLVEQARPVAKAANRKKIRIVDPTTGEEVDLSSKPPSVVRTTSEPVPEPAAFETIVEPGPESCGFMPEIISDILASAVSSNLSLNIEKPLKIETVLETQAKKAPPGFEQPRLRSQSMEESVSPRPGPPPGFAPKTEVKTPEPEAKEVENVDWIVKHVAGYLREKTGKGGKLMKTEKVFAAFQQETGSEIGVNEFMDILKSHSAIFRFSASGSKIELVEIIELKIVQFVISELVKMPAETGAAIETLYDAYISTMRDPHRVIHVGSKFSFDEFCDLVENRAQDVVTLSPGENVTLFLSEILFSEICSIVTQLLKTENDAAKPADLFMRFQKMASERIVFFTPFEIFIEILTRRNDLFRFANSRISLAGSGPSVVDVTNQPQLIARQTSGGMGDLDDFGQAQTANDSSKIQNQAPTSFDLDRKISEILPVDEGNFELVKHFVEQFNEIGISSSEILPVRPLPEPLPNSANELVGEFRGIVSCVSMETRRVFIAFPRDPVGAGYSTSQDLTGDDDFQAFAQATIHNGALRKSLAPGWCDIGHVVLFYAEESDSYGRGVVMSSFALPHCDVNVNVNVVESLTILDIDTGVVHEKIPARNASALTKYRDIPCLVVRCSFGLEPGALPPKKRSVIRFTLDTRSLYPPSGAKDKPAKTATARAARINDYRSGVSPLPIIILAP